MTAGPRVHPRVGPDVGCAGDVARLHAFEIHAEILVRNVEETRARRPRRRLPVLGAGGRRADLSHDLAELRLLLVVVDEPAARGIDAPGRRDVGELRGRQHLAGRAIEHVHVAVAIGSDGDLAAAPLDVEVEEDQLVDAVVVVEVVRGDLIGPDGLTGRGAAREDRRRPFVVTGALPRIPRAGVAGAVVEQVELGIVGDPAPRGAAAEAPRLGRPRRDAEIGSLIERVERPEAGADEHVLVGPGAPGPPDDAAAAQLERGEPAAHAQLAAAVADQDLVTDDKRSHRHRLAPADVAELRKQVAGYERLMQTRGIRAVLRWWRLKALLRRSG